MARISRAEMYMQMAEACSLRATCSRLAVGALIVTGRRHLYTGYNGPPSGEPHCTGPKCKSIDASGRCTIAIHAELNAIRLAENGERQWLQRRVKSWDLYCTHLPCDKCAAVINNSLVRRVIYRHDYKHSSYAMLVVPVFQLLPSGFCLDKLQDELIEAEKLG